MVNINKKLEEILEHYTVLTGIEDEDYKILAEHKDKLATWKDDVVKDFYDTLFNYEPTKKIFHEGERPKVEKTLEEWYLGLLEGKKEFSFWEHQWFVGLVHIARGVDNAFMHSMMARVQNLIAEKCFQEFPPEEAKRVYTAFKKITDTIAGVIMEGYFIQYIESIVRMTGIKEQVIERMAKLESKKMIEEYRAKGV
jgi:hypothetical protein